jgi:phosphosulfolactate phosphohydrolase-like enzyme
LGNDSAQVAWLAWQAVERLSAAENLAETDRSVASKEVAACVQEFHRARGGRNLVAAGFAEDLVAVAQLDRLAWIPQQYSAGSFRGTSWD